MQPVTITLLNGQSMTGFATTREIFDEKCLEIQIPIFDGGGQMTGSKTILAMIKAIATVAIVDDVTVRMMNLPYSVIQPAPGVAPVVQPPTNHAQQKPRVVQPLPGQVTQGSSPPAGFENIWPSANTNGPSMMLPPPVMDANGIPIYTNENLDPTPEGRL